MRCCWTRRSRPVAPTTTSINRKGPRAFPPGLLFTRNAAYLQQQQFVPQVHVPPLQHSQHGHPAPQEQSWAAGEPDIAIDATTDERSIIMVRILVYVFV